MSWKFAILAMAGVLLFAFGCKKSNDRHAWLLPNNERLEYYEGYGDSGFTANIQQHLKWFSEQRGTNDTIIGVGGSEHLVALYVNRGHSVAWITGQLPGQGQASYLAVLDLVHFQVVGGECMWQSESHSSALELRLRDEVEQSIQGATIIEEK